MRTRTKKKLVNESPCIIRYWDSSHTLLRTEYYPNGYYDRISEIQDVVDNPLGFNDCDHLVFGCDPIQRNTAKKAWHPQHGLYVEIVGTGNHASSTKLWPTVRPDLDFGPALEELERNARGDMSTHVNMVVNAAEVAELKGLVKSACSALKALTRRWRISNPRVRRQLKGRRRKGRRAAYPSLQEIADSHLAYSFGVAPLMRDIAGFLEINQKIRDRRAELAERSLKPTRINARVVATAEGEVERLVAGNANDWPLVNQKFSYWTKGTGVVSATCSAFYNLDNPSTRWKHVSQALGLTSPLTSIWNLIPFSFVADWFLPIGAAIKRVERAGWDLVDEAAVTTAYTLTDYHYSTKYEGVTICDGYVAKTVVPQWNGLHLARSTQRWSHYVRCTGMPATPQWWPDQSSDWSVSRTALSVSLSLQRIKSTPKPAPKKWPSLTQIYTKAKHMR